MIICYRKGGYKIYNFGNKVTPISFTQYPEQIVYYKVPLKKQDIPGKNKNKQGKHNSRYYGLPEYYQIVHSLHHYFSGAKL